MAIGKASDFKIYQEYMRTRVTETLTQNGAALSGASGGAIRLSSMSKRGDYAYESFFESISGLVSERDTTSVAAATDLAMTQDENISVKLNRKIGPVAQTRDAFRKAFGSFSQTEFSGIVGQQAAVAMQLDMLNSGLLAARAALVTGSTTLYTVPSSGEITTAALVEGLAKLGDRADRIVAWVMHSKQFFDLLQNQIAANIDGITSMNVMQGNAATLGRPVIITDSASLAITSGSPAVTDYHCLGLTRDSIVLENTETEEVVLDDVTGLANLVVRMQGEFAYNVGVKGFKWDTANGGVNPNAAALGTGTNWDQSATSYKDWAGVVIKSR
jgi:hypothetical protein